MGKSLAPVKHEAETMLKRKILKSSSSFSMESFLKSSGS